MKKSYIIFLEFAIFVFFLIELNYDWNQSQILHWGAVALLLLAHMIKNGGVFDLNFKDYSLWMGGIIFISVISLVFTISLSNSVNMLKSLFVIFVAFFVIRNYMTDEDKMKKILTLYLVAVLINMIYIITHIDLSIIGEEQLGDAAIEGWNGNSIGLMASSAAVLCVYMLIQKKSLFSKIFYLAMCSFLIYIFLYTGSRKSIVLFVVCLIVMLFASNPHKKIRNVLISVIIIFGAYVLVMNVESIYNVLGVRLEGFFASFTGEGEIDSSTLLRQKYIKNGWEWIKENPIAGYGLDGYRQLNGPKTGHFTYSHNNFIEMAINWGVGGFLYYYSAYFVIIKGFFKYLKNNLLAVTVFSLFIVNLILHYGMVAYYDIWQNLLLCIGFAFINIKKFEKVEAGKEND